MYKYPDIIEVYLPLKLQGSYSYQVPKDLQLEKGDIVLVPLRNTKVIGIVYEKQEKINFSKNKLKEVIKRIENIPSLNTNLIDFLKWLSRYYMANFGNVLKLAINITGFNFNSYEEIISLNEAKLNDFRYTEKRSIIIDFLKQEKKIEKKDLIKQTKISRNIINSLLKQGVLEVINEFKVSNLQQKIDYQPLGLSLKQKEVASNIIKLIKKDSFEVATLFGLPGSGKTEIYFEAINEALKKGKQTLILLPEIALSSQITKRFKDRFQVEPYIWHSDISKAKKKEVWIASNTDKLKVVIGARSSLFLPFKDLGLIIIDEEHDQSFKQEEGVIYNARDMAVLRAKILNIPIILGSATPSMETMYNVEQGKYHLFTLNSRYNQQEMPKIKLIDLNKEKCKKNKALSPALIEKITDTMKKKEQSLLFLNKRGYAHCLYCTNCKEKVLCKNCSVTLSRHQLQDRVICHYCGYSKKVPNICEFCNKEGTLISLGIGVEKLYEEVKEIFPQSKVAIFSSDTINSYGKAKTLLQEVLEEKYDILIGTQIISKGYHFPKLTFVGIVDGDFSYTLDLKANEKTWQMLYQVAGRSGREHLKGEVYIQSYNPDSNLNKSLLTQDYQSFLYQEMQEAKRLGFPPFGKMVAIIVSSEDKILLNDFSNYLSSKKPKEEGFEILGPAEAPIFYLRNRYRYRFLIKANKDINVQRVVKSWLNNIYYNSKIKLQVDIDPLSFY